MNNCKHVRDKCQQSSTDIVCWLNLCKHDGMITSIFQYFAAIFSCYGLLPKNSMYIIIVNLCTVGIHIHTRNMILKPRYQCYYDYDKSLLY